jgi:hypothetical protein
MKLKYWIRIVLMDESRLVKRVYKCSRDQYINYRKQNWCSVIHRLVIKYNLLHLWKNEKEILEPKIDNLHNSSVVHIRNYWYRFLRCRVHEIEQGKWLTQLEKKPKLRTYKTFKKRLKLEQYLLSEKNKEGRYLLTRIRSGTHALRIETGRWTKPKENEEERVCRQCLSGEVENERHFILKCTVYEELREQMFESIREKTNGRFHLNNKSEEERWQALMNSEIKPIEVCEELEMYVQKAFKQREKR